MADRAHSPICRPSLRPSRARSDVLRQPPHVHRSGCDIPARRRLGRQDRRRGRFTGEGGGRDGRTEREDGGAEVAADRAEREDGGDVADADETLADSCEREERGEVRDPSPGTAIPPRQLKPPSLSRLLSQIALVFLSSCASFVQSPSATPTAQPSSRRPVPSQPQDGSLDLRARSPCLTNQCAWTSSKPGGT